MQKSRRNHGARGRAKRAPLVADRRANGAQGEIDVIKRVLCPNCESRLVQLPPSFPIFDVQCSRCLFRAQVKSAKTAPKGEVFGGGWDIIAHHKRAGGLAPPLIASFSWSSKGHPQRAIFFFPFLRPHNMRSRVRSLGGAHPGYREFNYVGLFDQEVPRVLLYSQGDWQRRKKRAQGAAPTSD